MPNLVILALLFISQTVLPPQLVWLSQHLNQLFVSSAHAQSPQPDFSCDPPTVGLQVGHLDNQNPPPELSFLKGHTGAIAGGIMEWQANNQVATATADILKSHGINVQILPAVIEPNYHAAAFIAIHADGNPNPKKHGFKISPPTDDSTFGQSQLLSNSIEFTYSKSTSLSIDPNTTTNMTDYYAFNSSRHSAYTVDSSTPSAIIETGFLTNASDRQLIMDQTDKPATGLAGGIIAFLASQPDFTPCS